MSDNLCAALVGIDWNSLSKEFCDQEGLASRVEETNLRLAIWSNQLEKADLNNPALAFVREMQASGHNVASLIALGLYKPAAASMRATVECALYYVYFRQHPAELQTLVRDVEFYVTKAQILEFYKAHVLDFSARQTALGFVGRLSKWYSQTSAIVHGQIPGAWTSPQPMGGGPFSAVEANEVVNHFMGAVMLIQDNFLCAVGDELWKFFDIDAKKYFMKNMSGPLKVQLNLTIA